MLKALENITKEKKRANKRHNFNTFTIVEIYHQLLPMPKLPELILYLIHYLFISSTFDIKLFLIFIKHITGQQLKLTLRISSINVNLVAFTEEILIVNFTFGAVKSNKGRRHNTLYLLMQK